MWAIIAIALLAPGQNPQQAAKRPTAKAAPAPAVRVVLPADKPCTDPLQAVSQAVKDARQFEIDGGDATLVRYVWVPDWISPQSGFAQVSLVVNSTISRTSNLIQPFPFAGGRLVRIELEKFTPDSEKLEEIISLYEQLAPRDSYFNTPEHGPPIQKPSASPAAPQPPPQPAAGDPVEILISGQWRPAKYVREDGPSVLAEQNGMTWRLPRESMRRKDSPPPQAPAQPVASPPPSRGRFVAEHYLGEPGRELFELTQSSVPIMRLDEWVAFTFSTVNGGLYYSLAGVEANLSDTVAKFAGADAAAKILRQAEALREAQAIQRREGGKRSIREIALELDAELAKSKAMMNESAVTGRQRLALFVAGSAIPPTEGMQLVSVTYDISEDNTDPNSDPNRSLDIFETYNGGEAILILPNGMLLYLVFDANDKIIASVPDNVAHDFEAKKVRSNVATTRVFAGVSCANCHDSTERNWGWQPVRNDVYDDMRGIMLLLGARKNQDRTPEKIKEMQRLASAYRADSIQLAQMLDGARISYQRAVSRATGAKSSREVVLGLADSYWGYWYDAVTPELAARDLGQVFDKNAAQAFLLREVEPEKPFDLLDTLREDRILAILKDGRQVTPAQWRVIYPFIASRLIVSQKLKAFLKPSPPIPPEEP